jgi:hypothetical protein
MLKKSYLFHLIFYFITVLPCISFSKINLMWSITCNVRGFYLLLGGCPLCDLYIERRILCHRRWAPTIVEMAKELEIIHVEMLWSGATSTHGHTGQLEQHSRMGLAQRNRRPVGFGNDGRGAAQQDMLGWRTWREMFCWLHAAERLAGVVMWSALGLGS